MQHTPNIGNTEINVSRIDIGVYDIYNFTRNNPKLVYIC